MRGGGVDGRAMLGDVTEGQAPAERSRAFRERARLEADRYGPDPWIFVRELLQNSRDAGANQVAFTVGERTRPDGTTVEWMTCHDDGEGMTFDHARRYLFALYASSKEDRKNQAGKFGVGFWSILRFEPASIVIRSRPRAGKPWTVRLDGTLERAEHLEPPTRAGTEILLERPKGDGRLEHRIYDAVWQSARYLHRRDATDQPLPITINGRSANAEFGLGAPSASFRRRRVRGVVGLGRAPRVELFCRGLRVRSAACLEDLVAPAGRHTARIRVQFPELPEGLAPVALLESNALEVMLSRSDARDGRALARLVKLAQRELERLVERQLSYARPMPWYRRGLERMSARFRDSLLLRTTAGSLVGATVAVQLSVWLWGGPSLPSSSDPEPASPAAVGQPAAAGPGRRTYADLGQRYRGPRVDVLTPEAAEPVQLSYAPTGERLYFAALRFPDLLDDGAPDHRSQVRVAGTYAGVSCGSVCIDVVLPVADRGVVRLPVPTGHRIVQRSVAFDEQAITLHVTDDGHPAIDLGEGRTGRLRYQTTPAADPSPPPPVKVVSQLPPPLEQLTRELSAVPINQRTGELLAYVVEHVGYDRSPQMAARHTQAQAEGRGFVQRTLELGKGDCDVQNGLLVALMQAAGVSSRLAVGYLGVDGKALPWLHAWVEYRDEHGHWLIADASTGSAAGTQAGPPPVPVPGPGPGPGPDSGPDPAPTPDVGPSVEAPSGPSSPAGETPSVEPPVDDPSVATTEPVIAAVGPSSQPPTDSAPPVTPAPPSSSSSSSSSTSSVPPWLWPGLSLALLLGALGLMFGGRTRRAFKLDDSADLSRLLQGALQQPGAFGAMSALLYRPLVPLVGDRAISLQRARELSANGKLYRTEQRPPLAQRAARAGAAVLDAHCPEGRTVADALGAVDLDVWSARLRDAWTTPVIDEINALLEERNERWSLRVGASISGRIAALDLDALRVRPPGLHGSRVVMVDAACAWLSEAEARYPTAPRAAAFSVLDHVADELDLPEERRAALLAEGARAALLESFPAEASR